MSDRDDYNVWWCSYCHQETGMMGHECPVRDALQEISLIGQEQERGMSRRTRLIEGLKIAEEVDKGGDVDAQHDVIFICPVDTKFTVEQQERLIALGFVRDDAGGGWRFFV